MTPDADVIVVGAGLSGLVATAELADAGRRVLLLDQEPEASLGGQAFWSFGGLMLVDSPEQRRLRVRDSRDLAWHDWLGAAAFDSDDDHWPRRWAEAYVDFAAGEKRSWLYGMGVRFLPVVQWAERGGYLAEGHGNTVPPDHVDGRMLETARSAGARLIGADRMWHYPEGVRNPEPIWSRHGIRILSGPSPLWLDANGRRLPTPLFPGFDALGVVEHLGRAGHEHSWFLLNQRILAAEFALSGSEQNPDLTGRDRRMLLKRALPGQTTYVEEFARRCPDFVRADTVRELVERMNGLAGEPRIDAEELEGPF
jgi:predicted oxidoreductase